MNQRFWRHHFFSCRFPFPGSGFFGSPLGPHFIWGPGPFPRRREYLRMLEEYKRELEVELKEVEEEIAELKKE